MEKQIAIDWLKKEYELSGFLTVEDFKQAKEMEKEQIKDAFNDGVNDECIGGSKTPEQYYNENYKSE
jgi:hypothetical protein